MKQIRKNRAFTLIELLLVLVILAILAAVVVPKFSGRTEQARNSAAKADISMIETALDAIEIDNGRYQYSPVLDGRINTPASSSALRATQAAISGWDPSNGANGFYNPSKTVNQWVRSQTVTATIGNHVFFSY
jgi:prepilin-type N-terminal cleavage/methylation domain-containing protein